MQSKIRKYGNPEILNQLAEIDRLKESGVQLKQEDLFARPDKKKLDAKEISAIIPVVKTKSVKKKKRAKAVNVYVSNSDIDLLVAVSEEFGYNKSQAFKIALHYFARKHKINK